MYFLYFPDDIQEVFKNMSKILNMQDKILVGQEVLKSEVDKTYFHK